MPKYKTLRIREEDYEKLRDIQRLLRKKGTDAIDWEALKEQDLLEVPGMEEEEDDEGDLTWGVLVGLGAAALAYLLWKRSQQP